jgi:protein-tyrosine phosphatase
MKERVRPKKPAFEYSPISRYIYIGTNQCCQKHFKKSLIKKGIKVDISLEKEHLDAPHGVDLFLWIPVKDHTAPSLKQLLIGADFIMNAIRNKYKVYVHCKNGHGRSPTLVAAYLILKGMNVDDALNLIKSKRPVIHLNKLQVKALRNFWKIAKKFRE